MSAVQNTPATYFDMTERVAAILRSASQVAGCYIDAAIGDEEDALIARGLIYRDASDDFFIEQAGVDLLAQWDLGLELAVQWEALHGSPADYSQNTPAVPPRTAGATGEAGPTPVPGLPTSQTGEVRHSAPAESPDLPTPKWPLRVHESWDGGCTEISTDMACNVKQVVVAVVERGSSAASNRLKLAELDELIAALQAARAEIAEPEDEEAARIERLARLDNAAEDGFARAVADALANARAELLANSTPVTDPELLADLDTIRREKWAETAHDDQGHAGLSLLVAVGVGGGLLLLAAATGHHLPVSTHPNGFTLLVMVALVAVLWVGLRRPAGPAVYELADWDDDGELSAETLYVDTDDDPFYGTDVDHDPTGWRP